MAGIQLMDSATAAKYNYEHSWSLWFKSGSSTGNAAARILTRDCSDYMCVTIDQSVNPNVLDYVTQNISLNTWYHLAVTTDNGTDYDWYLNSKLVGSTTEPLSGASRPWVLGAGTEGDGIASGNEFEGSIDDVRFFDHKLSVKEIRELSRGITLHYPFESRTDHDRNAVTDVSGQGLSTVIGKGFENPPQFVEDSAIGEHSYEFDGTNSELITVSDSTGLSPTSEITVSAWLYLDSALYDVGRPWGTSYRSAISKGSLVAPYAISWNAGTDSTNPPAEIVAEVETTSSGRVQCIFNASLDEWFHVVLVYDGSNVISYLNGSQSDIEVATGQLTTNTSDLNIGWSGSDRYFAGKIDDVRIYTRALTADDVLGLYQTKGSLDKVGNFTTTHLEENIRPQSGKSMWYAFGSDSVTYASIYSATEIIEYDPSDGSKTVIVSKTSGDANDGTISTTAGRYYYGTRPVAFFPNGSPETIMPLSMKGKLFGSYSTRYNDSTYNILSPFGDATINVYDATVNGIDSTPTSTISASQGVATTYVTSTESSWVFFESDYDIIMSVGEELGDRMRLPPMSQYVYRRRDNSEITSINTSPSTVSTYVVSDPTYPCAAVEIGDGSGSDSTQGIGLENLSTTYAWGLTLSDYQLVAPYANTTVDVSYWDGAAWQLGESHSLDGTLTSPDAQFRDGDVGFGSEGTNIAGTAASLGAGSSLWKFVGTKPFALTVNDQSSDEETLYGWGTTEKLMSPDRKAVTKTPQISEVGPADGLVAWWPLKNDVLDYTENRNDGKDSAVTLSERGYEFNGSTSNILIINEAALQVVDDLTISFWLYINTLSTRTTLIDKAYGGEYTINLETAGDLRLYRGTGGGNTTPYDSVDSPTIFQTVWNFCCIRIEGTTATWNINGVDETSSTASNFVGSISTNDVTLGTGYTSGHLDGFLSDVRIYNRALSFEEINTLYEITDPTSTQRMKISKDYTYLKNEIRES